MLQFSPSLNLRVPSSSTPQQWPLSKPHRLVSLLQLSNSHHELLQIHSLFLKTSLIQDSHAFAPLLFSFASLSDPAALIHARRLLKSSNCPHNNAFLFNSVIKSFSRHGDYRGAVLLFSEMLLDGVVDPDRYTLTFVCSACAKSLLVFEGRQVHARMVKSGSRVAVESWNSLMDFYLKVGEDLWKVRKIFEGMGQLDVVSGNCLIHGYVKSGELESARKLFDEMPERDAVSWTTMLVGYADAGLLSEARHMFDEMRERNMVSWTAMINGYARSGRCKEALELFKEMQVLEIEVDKITFTTLLSACAGLGALDQGRWIHAFIDKRGIKVDAHLCTGLVDMYVKCGRIDIAQNVFQQFPNRKVFLWNAMLGGLAMHSLGIEAIGLFSEMLDDGVKPNEITFICVLSACSHSGLIDEGLQIFHSMAKDHKIEPAVEHYGCIVDLLSRAGLLDEAKKFIEAMPVKADGNVWRALLGACKLHGYVELGEQVGRILLELEPFDDGNYVLLSSVYAIMNKWEHAAKFRRVMKERRVKKQPGWSCIELDGIAHMFVAGDCSHSQSTEIYTLLDGLAKQIVVD